MPYRWEPEREMPILSALLCGNKLWDISDKKKHSRKRIKELRRKISEEHEYMCNEEPVDQFHANILLGALNLLDGLLDKNQDVLKL